MNLRKADGEPTGIHSILIVDLMNESFKDLLCQSSTTFVEFL